MSLGIKTVRVRHHENMARIEVSVKDMPAFMQHHDKVQANLISLGFTYVSLDLRGYRTGNMNEVLTDEDLEREIS